MCKSEVQTGTGRPDNQPKLRKNSTGGTMRDQKFNLQVFYLSHQPQEVFWQEMSKEEKRNLTKTTQKESK